MHPPREYQARALDKIYSELQIKQNVLLSAIMGAGKTFMCVRLIQRLYSEKPDMPFLILAHKEELIQQFEKSFYQFTDISHFDVGLCCAGLGEKITNRRITIATVQTFVNIMENYSGAGLIIIDECHRIDINGDTQYKKILDYLRLQRPGCRLLGCTATPSRLGHGYIYGNRCKPGRINLFDDISHKITYNELLKEGHLVKLKGVVASHESLERDLAGVSVNGDYVLDQLGDIMCKIIHLRTAIEAINQYCQGYNRICVFCCTIEHAEKLHEMIGSESTIVHSQLTQLERHINMKSWKSGSKRIMTSVNILTEGFDMPVLDCLVFARPTLSSTLFLQAVGRVLRTHEGKNHGLLVDLTDNTARFGTDLDNVKITIPKVVDASIKKEHAMWKICPSCDIEVHIAIRECQECGYVWSPTECIVADALPEMKEVIFAKQPPVWFDVFDYRIQSHKSKKNGKILGKIDFYFDASEYKRSRVSMFLCFADQYDGYAVAKSEERWQTISDDYFPESTDEFLRAVINTPTEILVDLNGQYPELLDVKTQESQGFYVDDQDINIDIPEANNTDFEYDDELPF